MEDGALGLIKCICLPDIESGDFYGPNTKGQQFKGDAVKIKPEEHCHSEVNKKLLWKASEEAVQPFLV